jgi:schlafen family protein
MARAIELFSRIEQGGEPTILSLVSDRKSEELFLDFKRSADNGTGSRLHDGDRNNLAKAISGFGNSEGGVIVWGVDCSRDTDGADVARARVPIHNVTRFVSWLESAVSGCTVPPHQGVRSVALSQDAQGGGYAVTLIPKSNHAPHQVVGRMQYFIRAGSDFVPTPHGVLAGMFGRVPQPHVFHSYLVSRPGLEGTAIKSAVGIALCNEGPGIASDLFLSVRMDSHPGRNSEIRFDPPDRENWTGIWAFERGINLICKAGYRLPPEAQVQPLILHLTFAPPFESDLEFKGIAGAGGAPPYRFTLNQTAAELGRAHTEYLQLHRDGRLTEDRARALQSILIGHVGL